jgi:type IV pilus assembly protein PilF
MSDMSAYLRLVLYPDPGTLKTDNPGATGILRWLVFVAATLLLVACASSPSSDKEQARLKEAAKLNVELGVGYLNEGDLELSKVKLERALEQDPELSSAHWSYALLQMRLGDKKLAEKYLKQAIDLNPNDARARNNYGFLLCNEGRVEEAEKQFLLAARNPLYKTPAVAYTNAGLCLLKIDGREKAERYFRAALEATPSYAPALYQLAKLTFEQGKYLQSRAFMQRYAQSTDHSSQSLWLSYRIERHLGNRGAAEAFASQLKDRFPDSQEATKLLELERHGR